MKENEAILELVDDDVCYIYGEMFLIYYWLDCMQGTPITKKPIQLIDVPGHERLRFRYTDFLPITRGVIFVVDSTTIGRSARATAE